MKKILVLTAALFALSNVWAQENDIPQGKVEGGEKPGMMHGGMHHQPDFSRLNLTEEQRIKVKELHVRHRAEMMALREKHKGEMQVVLTPEQWEKLQAMMPKRMQGHGGMMKGDKMKEGMMPERGESEESEE